MRYRYDQMHNVLVEISNELKIHNRIECSPESRDTWRDGQVVEEGVDFIIDDCPECLNVGGIKGLHRNGMYHCKTCNDYTKLATPISKPPIPDDQGQEELWKEVALYIYDKPDWIECEADRNMLNELKSQYTITRKPRPT